MKRKQRDIGTPKGLTGLITLIIQRLIVVDFKELKNQFNDDVGALSALTIMNPFRIEIQKFFKNKSKTRDNVVRAIFAYTASRTVNSAPFVIAKD